MNLHIFGKNMEAYSSKSVKTYSTMHSSCLFLLIYTVFLQKTRKDISRHTLKISSLLWTGQKNLCMCKIFKPNCNWGWITRIQPVHDHQNSQLHLSQWLTSTSIAVLKSSGWKFNKSNHRERKSLFLWVFMLLHH